WKLDVVNTPPVIQAIGDMVVNEGTMLAFQTQVEDAETTAGGLIFSLKAGSPDGVVLDPKSGAFSWVPSESQGPGIFHITVRVTDDGSPPLSNEATFTVTVREVNRPPVLAHLPDRQVNEGEELTFTASATDPDIPANKLTFSLGSGAPVGAYINPQTGEFYWTPTEAQGPGSPQITVRVT